MRKGAGKLRGREALFYYAASDTAEVRDWGGNDQAKGPFSCYRKGRGVSFRDCH